MNNSIPFRRDAISKVAGTAKYSADFQYLDMLYARPLWTPAVGVRITKIDTSLAQDAEGVVRIFTKADIPGNNEAPGADGLLEFLVMVGEGDPALFCGDVLALVVANSKDQADRASALITVEHEPLDLPETYVSAKQRGQSCDMYREIKKGDVKSGFEAASVIIERPFHIPANEHAYIEPEAAVGYIDDHDNIVINVGSQDAYNFQSRVARALNVPASRIRIHVPYTGGAFGGKHLPSVHILTALAVFHLHRPVNLTWTREESIMASCKKQGSDGWIKLGVSKDGRITALSARLDMETSARAGYIGDNLFGVLDGIVGPYRIPNIDLEGRAWVTLNGPFHGAFRGVARPDGSFVFEPLLTAAGRRLGLDELEIRRRNWIRSNPEFLELYPGCFACNLSPSWDIERVAKLALESAGPVPAAGAGKIAGRGFVACKAGYAYGNLPYTCPNGVRMEMFYDGSVMVHCGLPEIGEGITGIMDAFISEHLGIPEDRINISLGDTHSDIKAGNLSSSQATVTVGNSILDACEKLLSRLNGLARACLGSDDPSIHYEKGAFFNGSSECVLDWAAFSDYAFCEVDTLTVEGRVSFNADDDLPMGLTPVACVCDIEFDPQSGEYRILSVVQAHDSGKVIHYDSARGQMLGGALMAAGGAMMEEYTVTGGMPVTRSLAEYLIPTSMDVPLRSEAVFYEKNPASKSPDGAKGMGEHGLTAMSAALSAALYDACGELLLEQPLTPERILRATGKLDK